MSGAEFAVAIEREFPSHATRLLFMTGGALTDAMREFVASHADRVLEKPLDFVRLSHHLALLDKEPARA